MVQFDSGLMCPLKMAEVALGSGELSFTRGLSPVMRKQFPSVLLLAIGLQLQAHAGQAAAASDASQLRDLARVHRWQEVVSQAREAIQRDPQNRQAYFWQGSAELETQEFVQAVKSLRAAQKLGLDDAPLHEQLGLAYYRLNQFVLFEREMNLAIDRDSKDFLPHYYLGFYQLTIRSDMGQARHYFAAAAALAPADWKVMYQQGNCWEKEGQNDKAREYYLRSVELIEKGNVQFGWPFQGLARIVLQENPGAAVEYAEQAVKRTPHEYSNYLMLAHAYKEVGQMDKAIEAAKQAVVENPSDAETRYFLFQLYRKVGASEAAAQELAIFRELQATYGTQ